MRAQRLFALIFIGTLLGAVGIASASSEAAQATINVASAPFDVGSDPMGIAMAPNGLNAYIANYGSNTVSVFSLVHPAASHVTINVGTNPRNIAVTPNGAKVYVTNFGSNSVSAIDVSTNTVTQTVTVGAFPSGIAISPDGTKAYVTNSGDGTVSVITLATGIVSRTFTLTSGAQPIGIAISPNGRFATITDYAFGHNQVYTIDLATNVVGGQNVGTSPYGIVFTPDSTKALITNFNSHTVSVLDVASNQVTATIPVGFNPTGIAINPSGTSAYVAHDTGNKVSVIDLRTLVVTESRAMGFHSSVAITPNGAQAWVATRYPGGFGSVFSLDVAEPMVLKFNVPNGATLKLPLRGFIGTIGWGDGTFSSALSSANYGAPSISHTYAQAATVNVTVVGAASGFGFEPSDLDYAPFLGADLLQELISWGDLGPTFTTLNHGLSHTSNLTAVPANVPPTVTNLSYLFGYSPLINDSSIGAWDTSHVTNMSGTFEGASAFNQNLNSWNTSAVTDMSYMFDGAVNYNQPMNGWDTANVTSMAAMFKYASTFNGAIDAWNTTHVENMNQMFSQATAFNQNISGWDISRATNMRLMFNNSALSTLNYSRALRSWSRGSHLQNISLDARDSHYFASVAADRAALLADGWSIVDLGEVQTPVATLTQAPYASAIAAGDALNRSLLTGGSASIPGTFTFTTPTAIPSGGSQTVSVTFTPSDSVAYAPFVTSVPILVNSVAVETNVNALSHTGSEMHQQLLTGLLLLLAGLGLVTLAISNRRRN